MQYNIVFMMVDLIFFCFPFRYDKEDREADSDSLEEMNGNNDSDDDGQY